MSERAAAQVWYHDGLRFACTRCGGCCRGEPGYVWVSRRDIRAIARFLERPVEEVLRDYVRQALGDLSLVEHPNGDCVFWRPEGCAIYPVRPVQCRTFPFWRECVGSPRAWKRVARRCPGVNAGRLHTAPEIVHLVELTDAL